MSKVRALVWAAPYSVLRFDLLAKTPSQQTKASQLDVTLIMHVDEHGDDCSPQSSTGTALQARQPKVGTACSQSRPLQTFVFHSKLMVYMLACWSASSQGHSNRPPYYFDSTPTTPNSKRHCWDEHSRAMPSIVNLRKHCLNRSGSWGASSAELASKSSSMEIYYTVCLYFFVIFPCYCYICLFSCYCFIIFSCYCYFLAIAICFPCYNNMICTRALYLGRIHTVAVASQVIAFCTCSL